MFVGERVKANYFSYTICYIFLHYAMKYILKLSFLTYLILISNIIKMYHNLILNQQNVGTFMTMITINQGENMPCGNFSRIVLSQNVKKERRNRIIF